MANMKKISSKIALNSSSNAKNNQATKPYTIGRLHAQGAKLYVNLWLVIFLCDYDQDWVWKVFSRFEHIASMQKAVVTS